jgi:hypothetical protein
MNYVRFARKRVANLHTSCIYQIGSQIFMDVNFVRVQVGAQSDEDPLKRLLLIKELPAPMDSWLENVVFSGEMNFFLTGEVSRKDLIIFGSDKSRDVSDLDDADASQKLTVFCAMSRHKVYGPFFVSDEVTQVVFYQRIFEESIIPQLEQDGISETSILQVQLIMK